MTTYWQIGSGPALDNLGVQLEAHGARVAQSAADLVLVGASTIDEATRVLDSLDADERTHAVVVGLDGSFDARERPEPGTLSHLLETYQPLGILRTDAVMGHSSTGFIGRKDHARGLDAKYLNLYSSRSYASWMGCPGEDPGKFLLRVVDARK